MKKILSVLLAVMMVIGTMSFTAFADGETWGALADTSWYDEDSTTFTLNTANQLAGLAKLVNEGNSFEGKAITLGSDIDLQNKEWTPIGTDAARFKGSFDGAGKTISNLYINLPETKGTGLFGYIHGQGISTSTAVGNFTIDNAKIICLSYTGVAIGQSWCNDDIEDITVTGKVEIDGTKSDLAGIVGYCGYNNIKNCHVLADEGSYIKKDSETSWFMGGIVGYMCEGNYTIANCSVKNLAIEGGAYAGGIAGCIQSGVKLDGNCSVENVEVDSDGSGLLAGAAYYAGSETMETKLATAVIGTEGSKLYNNGTEIVYPSLSGSEPNVAIIGDTTYTSLEKAIADAADAASAENPVTVQLMAGEFEVGNVQFPAVAENIIIKGAADHATILKNSAFRSADGSSICYNNITIDGIAFDNSYILFTGWRADATYKNWTITNCKFYDLESEAAVFFNLSDSVESEAMENFTFTNNVIDGVTGESKSGMGLNAATGNITITGNTIENVNWNAIQLINVAEGATVVITDNELQSDAEEGVLNLYNVQAGVTLEDNTITTAEGQPAYAYFDAIETDGKVYGSLDEAISNAGEGGSVAITTNRTMNASNMAAIADNGSSITLGSNVLTVEFGESDEVIDYSELIDVPAKHTLITTETTGEDGKTIVTYQLKKKKSSTTTLGVTGSTGGSVTVKYTVSFDVDGGSEIASQSVEKNGKVVAPADPEKEGCIFDGWYADKALTEAYDFEAAVTANTTVYAKWAEDSSANQIILTIGDTTAMVFGEEKENDVAPVIVNDRTMLPARFVAENLGATVTWTAEEPTKVLIQKGDIEIIIWIGSDIAYVNGEEVELDSPAFLENDRTYTPVRFIGEKLGATVEWNDEAKQAIITVPADAE